MQWVTAFKALNFRRVERCKGDRVVQEVGGQQMSGSKGKIDKPNDAGSVFQAEMLGKARAKVTASPTRQ